MAKKNQLLLRVPGQRRWVQFDSRRREMEMLISFRHRNEGTYSSNEEGGGGPAVDYMFPRI